MPKFVPVQDNEKPRSEQSLYDESFRKHRQFDDPHSVTTNNTKRGWGQGEMGWGVKKVFGSEKDIGAQVVKKKQTGDQGGKMVKNEKGLWVKVKSQQEEEEEEEEEEDTQDGTERIGAGRGRGRGGRGLSVMDHLSMSTQQRKGGEEEEEVVEEDEEQRRHHFDDPQDYHRHRHKQRESQSQSQRESRRRQSGSRSRDRGGGDDDDDESYHRRSSRRRSSSRSRRHRSRSDDSRDNNQRSSRRRPSHHHHDDRHSRRSRSRSRSRSADRHRHHHRNKHHSDDDDDDHHHKSHRRDGTASSSTSYGVNHHTKDDLTTRDNIHDKQDQQPLPSSVEKDHHEEEEEKGNDVILEITAVQVVNRFHEVFASSTSQRLDEIADLFLPQASIHSLKSQAVLLSGRDAIRESFQKTKHCKVTVSKRVFIHFQPHTNDKDYDDLVHWLVKEEDDDDDGDIGHSDGNGKQVRVTYVCDLHRQGTSPGLGDRSRDTVLLYECQGAQIGRIWGSVDSEHLSQEEDLTPEMFYQSKLWSQVMKMIQERRGSCCLQVERDSFYHNYDRMEVWG